MRSQIPMEATKHYARQCEHMRLEIICGLLKKGDSVLDIGCGVGNYISNPLGWLPISITAIDSDEKTIQYANQQNIHHNLEFIVATGEEFETTDKFDMIICSHVLEHTERPMVLLEKMKQLLKEDGVLYLGIPNGFGWFEIQNTIPRLMFKLKWGRRVIARMMRMKDTLNIDSQHVQFFTLGRINRLLKQLGWQVVKQINDEFLGGIIFDRVLPYSTLLAKWNVSVADKIPSQMANGWIFICKK